MARVNLGVGMGVMPGMTTLTRKSIPNPWTPAWSGKIFCLRGPVERTPDSDSAQVGQTW